MAHVSDELLREHSYLVARGVRALALAGWCGCDAQSLLRAATRVEMCASELTIPFVVDHGDGNATYGYAASRSVLDLYEWAQRAAIPPVQRVRIVGLLLGYSPAALSDFDGQASGRRFSSSLPEPGSTSPPGGSENMAGTSRPC